MESYLNKQREINTMQALKNIVINGAMILALLFGLTLSATAATAATNFEEVKALAESGDAWYQGYLGDHYREGLGVREDHSKAFYWYKKSADQGDAFGQAQIGLMYEFGKGVRQNKTIAKEWYGKGCDNGSQDGCDHYKKLNEQGY